jgi:transmembrane sensor
MSKHTAKNLLEKYNSGNCTEEEKAIVETWFLNLKDEGSIPSQQKIENMSDEIWSALPVHHPVMINRVRLWPRIAAAASILLVLSAGGYFILHKTAVQQQMAKHDIAPGHNQATLTLSNGQKIILTKGMNGKLAQQGNTQILVNSGNAIAYHAGQSESTVTYNTLSTARGEQSPYPLVLADGTQVWLNAASSITYPTVFNGKERSVTVTGEAYVIVAHNARQPFKLTAGGQTINDIGTEFNINAYTDEPVVTTTLAEGSIKIAKENQSVIIKPGQQAASKNTGITVSNANLESALAWKNGRFDFNNADVPAFMRQIARWYNVDVAYEGGIPNASINGSVFRNTNASNALKIVKLLGIPYRIEGRKIIITNTAKP